MFTFKFQQIVNNLKTALFISFLPLFLHFSTLPSGLVHFISGFVLLILVTANAGHLGKISLDSEFQKKGLEYILASPIPLGRILLYHALAGFTIIGVITLVSLLLIYLNLPVKIFGKIKEDNIILLSLSLLPFLFFLNGLFQSVLPQKAQRAYNAGKIVFDSLFYAIIFIFLKKPYPVSLDAPNPENVLRLITYTLLGGSVIGIVVSSTGFFWLVKHLDLRINKAKRMYFYFGYTINGFLVLIISGILLVKF